jgi:hypothetical protein
LKTGFKYVRKNERHFGFLSHRLRQGKKILCRRAAEPEKRAPVRGLNYRAFPQ